MEENHQEPKKNASGSTYIKAYAIANIERVKSIIEELGNQGKVKRYSILVDGEVVVPVNTDVENFDRYQPFIIAGSSTLEIRMYFGKSPNFNRHVFKHKQGVPPQNLPVQVSQAQSTSLEGIEKLVEEKYRKQHLEQRNVFLEKKLKRSKIKQRNYKLKIEEFEEQERKRQLNSPIQNMLFQGFSAYMKNQFNIDPIQGIATTDNDAEVEIEVEQEKLSKSDELYQTLKMKYHESNIESVLKIAHTLLAKPNIATEVKSLINQKLQDHGKA